MDSIDLLLQLELAVEVRYKGYDGLEGKQEKPDLLLHFSLAREQLAGDARRRESAAGVLRLGRRRRRCLHTRRVAANGRVRIRLSHEGWPKRRWGQAP